MAEHDISQEKILSALIEAGVSEIDARKIMELKDKTLVIGDPSSLSPEEVERVLLRAGFAENAVKALNSAMVENKISKPAQSVIKVLAKILGHKLGVVTGSPVFGIFSAELAERFFEYVVRDFQARGALADFLLAAGLGVGYLLAFPILGPIALVHILSTGGEPGEGNTLDPYEQFMP